MNEIFLEFIYHGNSMIIKCERNEYMKDIFKRYLIKINKNLNDVYFLCNGNKINEELKLEEINNKDNEIKILVNNIKDSVINSTQLLNQSKDIICPKCGNICIIDFKDYKITLNKCNNNHSIKNILLDEFTNLQNINEFCNNCNKKKDEIYNNQLYKCCNCNLNLCPICKSNHNKEHKIIDYEVKHYLCNIHGERYILYCLKCNLNLCQKCEIEHNKNHNYIYLNTLLPNQENNINELKAKIDKLKSEIIIIINKLQKIMDNMEIYYNINNNIFNNYNIKNQNYEILININNIYNYNEIIIKDINEIINENKVENKIKYLYNIYEKMITKTEIIKNYEIGKEDNIGLSGNKLVNNIQNKNESKNEIKKGFNIIEEIISFEDDLKLNALIKPRGLTNIGGTSYINATLQCLYHVKQLSESLINSDKINEKLELTYSFKKLIEKLAFTNIKKFKIDRKYNRVTGENINSINPEKFIELLCKKNPQFKGNKASDPKDLIIYLLKKMDKGITLRNNKSTTMKKFHGLNKSEMNKENFKEFHNSIISDLFFGFQSSEIICHSCQNCFTAYYTFYYLILPMEETYNSLNIENKKKKNLNPQSYHIFNGKLKVHDCIKEYLKDKLLTGDNQIYCIKCRRICDSTNKINIYKSPNILILILDRKNRNSFKFEINFSSKELLDLSRYTIINQNSPKYFELFGVISSFNKSSEGDHFIAYCKHFDDNWYKFDDSIAIAASENELTNGVPYILFYKNIDLNKEFEN